MGAAKSFGILFLVIGLIGLIGAAVIYNLQMSQDGKIVYENGNYYQLRANPQVVQTMTWGMIIGGALAVIGGALVLSDWREKDKPDLSKILVCRNCGYEVEDDYLRCPRCAAVLNVPCPSCGNALSPNWKACPKCGYVILPAAPQPPPPPQPAPPPEYMSSGARPVHLQTASRCQQCGRVLLEGWVACPQCGRRI